MLGLGIEFKDSVRVGSGLELRDSVRDRFRV